MEERFEFATELIKEYLPEYTFRVNNRLSRALGRCIYAPKIIEVSKHLIEKATDQEFLNTVVHEIAHGICGYRAGHNSVWKIKCLELGGNGQRCAKALSFKIERPDFKYTYKCAGNHSFKKYRRKPSRSTANIYCRQCGRDSLGKLKVVAL